MKKYVLAAALLAVSAGPAQAATIVGLYNTGVDANGVPLTDGSADTHYTVGGAGTFVYTNGAYLVASDAKFISVQADGGAANANNIFTLTFDLTGFNAATARLSGSYAADNYGSVFLNGVLLQSQPAATIFENFQQLTAFSATSGFVAGRNTLSFSVTDTGRPTALIVSGLNGSVAVPEPATWAMMLMGFGMVGFGLRSRRNGKVTTRVAFA